jgi:hypothetical protein
VQAVNKKHKNQQEIIRTYRAPQSWCPSHVRGINHSEQQ